MYLLNADTWRFSVVVSYAILFFMIERIRWVLGILFNGASLMLQLAICNAWSSVHCQTF